MEFLTQRDPDPILDRFLDSDGHLVATFINAGYFEYIHNLSINLKRIQVPWTLCVMCSDEEAHRLCQEHNIPSIYVNGNVRNQANVTQYSSWNDANWNNVTFMKLTLLQWLLSHSNVDRVTYMDGDIHVYQDFVPYLKSLNTNHYELCIQSDCMQPDIHTLSHHLCSGFFHFKNTARIRKIFEFTDRDVASNTFNADQEHIVNQVRKHNTTVMQLPRELFPNGVFFESTPPSAFLLHYNYMIGTLKKQNMQKKGHWYLSARKVFHHPTDVVYPPFKHGLYLEEYFSRHNPLGNYLDVFWTNLQIDPRFGRGLGAIVQKLLHEQYPDPNKRYFTVVQHDDGILLQLPPHTTIYAAGGTGHVPLPLIYEDTRHTLESHPRKSFREKTILCSFVGSITHRVRQIMGQTLTNPAHFSYSVAANWTNVVDSQKQTLFIDTTVDSKFCLAPRGYGRSSFRFFEAFQLGTVPIYVWDDMEWLPYLDILDYSKFAISIHVSKLGELESRLLAIDEEAYAGMLREYEQVKHWFTLEGMTQYIVDRERNRTA